AEHRLEAPPELLALGDCALGLGLGVLGAAAQLLGAFDGQVALVHQRREPASELLDHLLELRDPVLALAQLAAEPGDVRLPSAGALPHAEEVAREGGAPRLTPSVEKIAMRVLEVGLELGDARDGLLRGRPGARASACGSAIGRAECAIEPCRE